MSSKDYKKSYKGALLTIEIAGLLLQAHEFKSYLADIEEALRLGNTDDYTPQEWQTIAGQLKEDAKLFRAALRYINEIWDKEQAEDPDELLDLTEEQKYPQDMN